MEKWIDAGPVTDFPDGEHKCIKVDGHPLVVCHVEGAFYVLQNICPHAGLPLGEGERRGLVLTCPFHGYTYNIRNGKNIDFPDQEVPVRTYETKVEDGRVRVKIETEANS